MSEFMASADSGTTRDAIDTILDLEDGSKVVRGPHGEGKRERFRGEGGVDKRGK